jgi:hypothetical protein
MLNESKIGGVALGSAEGARSATEGVLRAAAEVKRWSAQRKKEVVLRLLRGEPVDAISREVSVPIYRLERWRDRALAGIEAGLKERDQAEGRRTPRSGGPERSDGCGLAAQNDPLEKPLDEANRRISEWAMEVEILRKERQARRPLVGRRSSR